MPKIMVDLETPIDCYVFAANHRSKITPEIEEIIATDAHCSYCYAFYFKQERFKKGEAVIATDPYFSLEYAQFVIDKRAENLVRLRRG